jgi:hypothetical protein
MNSHIPIFTTLKLVIICNPEGILESAQKGKEDGRKESSE